MDIALHCHSTASDGALPPAELIRRAHEHGVQTLALTDHDTIEGLPAAHEAAAALNMRLLNGVELSCLWGGATIHILGYDFALDDPAIVAATQSLHRGRWLRAEEISKRLFSANKVPYTSTELMINIAVALKMPPKGKACPASSTSRGSSLKTIKNKISGIKSMNCFTVRAITERKRHNSKHSR